MIEAIIFDLDGTLVQTEHLKALSYAQAAVELCPDALDQQPVVQAFTDVVGLSRREVAQALLARFGLEDQARKRMAEFGVNAPWQAYVQLRLRYYERMLADRSVLLDHRCPDNLAVLEFARKHGLATGLATMSRCKQATKVLNLLELHDQFQFVASRDDVEHGKPDPEIYRLVIDQLGLAPDHSLVLEDSAAGVKAALGAGTWCIASTNDFTRKAVHELGLLEPQWIVDDGKPVLPVVEQMLAARQVPQ